MIDTTVRTIAGEPQAARIERFLAHRSLAIVGASRSGRKFGNLALRVLRRRGYRVIPIHRSATTIDGVRCYARFADLPEQVGALLVVVPPVQALDVVRDAAAAGVTDIWLQQGAESPIVLDTCRTHGVEPVVGECVLMYAQPTGMHRFHRWLRRVRRSFGTDNRRNDGPA